MKIVKDKLFIKKLESIYNYIKKDKPLAARDFVVSLNKKFKNLKTFPKMYRKSIYFDDENYRDLIHMGYTVIYKIDNNYFRYI